MVEQIKAKDAAPGRFYMVGNEMMIFVRTAGEHAFYADEDADIRQRSIEEQITPLPDCTGWDWDPAPKHPPVPEGWRVIDKEKDLPKQASDKFVFGNGWKTVADANGGFDMARYYIRRIEPTYRPFASAEEFRPHRDRWWKYKDDSRETVRQPFAYSDLGHGNETWAQSLGRKVFDDGSPFGVEVKE